MARARDAAISSHGVFRDIPEMDRLFGSFAGSRRAYVAAMKSYLNSIPEQADVSGVCVALLALLEKADTPSGQAIALQVIASATGLGYTQAFLNMGVVQCLTNFMRGDEDMECLAAALFVLIEFTRDGQVRTTREAHAKPVQACVRDLRARHPRAPKIRRLAQCYFDFVNQSSIHDKDKAAQHAERMAAALIEAEEAEKKRLQLKRAKKSAARLAPRKAEPARASVPEPARAAPQATPEPRPAAEKQAAPTAPAPHVVQLSFVIEPNSVVYCLTALNIELSIDDLEFLTGPADDASAHATELLASTALYLSPLLGGGHTTWR